MTEAVRAGWRDGLVVAGLLGVRLLLDFLNLIDAPGRFWNIEEAHNATAGLALWQGGLWEQLLALQYRSFCGGCTVVSVLGSPLLGILGDRLVVWKLVAMMWSAVTLVVGFVALSRWLCRPAGWAFALLWALPPTGASELSLMLWGNHNETTLWVLVGLLLLALGRHFGVGLVMGAAIWFCRTALYGAVILVPFALWMAREGRSRARVLLGLGTGLSLLALPMARGDRGYYRMGAGDQLMPEGWSGVGERLMTLIEPQALSRRMFMGLEDMAGWSALVLACATLGGLAMLTGSGLRRRGLALVGLAVSYAVAYSCTGFPVFKMTLSAPINNARYHAPWLALLILIVAGGAGVLWSRGRRQRWLGVGILASSLLAHAVSWVELLSGWDLDPSSWHRPVTDLPRFGMLAAGRLEATVLNASAGRGQRLTETLDRARGYQLGLQVITGGRSRAEALEEVAGRAQPAAIAEGLGQALVEERWNEARVAEANAWLLTQPHAEDVGRGMGFDLGFGLASTPPSSAPGVEVGRAISFLRSGLTEGDPCWLCGGAGPVAAIRCGAFGEISPDALGACLSQVAQGHLERDAVLFGAAITIARPGGDPARLVAVRDALQPEDVEAFAAGLAHSAAGLAEPLELGRYRTMRASWQRGLGPVR